ncbi:ABC transporter permease [Dyadobacter chenwenxiniae]|uniref:ABC transporter permease n=1 Tax=Dyadobacter chenwenxiniae TaxID=2906456 RepID=A0A9X1PIX7_9BACT|nr:ABC transporter permease [Dyadobacter chenwenxiniae]MCF0060979.1 ABC transporter permease [Dyadobacter chenwenxiniae]UON80807.1 ABC transporter permease [Dyadobacter chenwenxiniae]
MIFSYFKIAIRNLWKHKLFSFINIVGLGLAMAFCLLQLIQVQSHFEKDTFHPYPDRTYRILTNATGADGNVYRLATTPFPLREKLQNEQSVIEKSARINRSFDGNLSNGLKSLRTSGMFVDPAYFEIFGFKLARGKAAIEPRTMVLTHETAERFFGDADPVGKTLIHPDFGTFTVTGVFKPLGKYKTHLNSDLVVSMASFSLVNPKASYDNWLDYNTYTFVLVSKNTQRKALDRALTDISEANKRTVDFVDIKGHAFRSQQLSEISPDFENLLNNPYVEPIWKISFSLLIPLIIILLSGFNYVNLTLTRSLSRAREVGVRKVAGAKRWQLIGQFLIETMLVATFALGVGYLGLVFMKSYIPVRWLTWEVLDARLLWLIFIGFTLFTGFLAGILPARILSSYQPVQILKGELAPTGIGKLGFRKVLTITQFVVALVFMSFIGISNSQFDYMATDNENFNRKNILNIPLAPGSDYKLLANEFSKEAGVESVGVTSAPFNENAGKARIGNLDAKGNDKLAKDAFIYAVDGNFVDNMKLTFVAGNNIPASLDTSVHFVVLNQKAVKSLGWKNPKDAIGQTVMLNQAEVIVSGVVKDFCIMRYELPVSSLVLAFNPKEIKLLSLRVAEAADRGQITASLSGIWKKYHPHESFVYSWYDQQLYENYSENGDRDFTRVMVIIVFAIASMGLLGMVTYTTEKRTKEVGVRKVMGASVVQIMQLLSAAFLKIMLVAAAIALPIGYFLGSLFLNIFTYHAKLGPGVFLICLGSLSLIGLLTIGIQTYKTAITNPAKTLKTD